MRKVINAILKQRYKNKKFNLGFSMAEFCNSIINLQYAFVKIDVPYMPDNFPLSIPIGKDADIICSKDDFGNIKHEVRKFTEKL